MTPAERVVVEATVRYVKSEADRYRYADMAEAVDALLAERAGPQPETMWVTWGQVVEGDKLYRGPDGRALEPDAPGGRWMEVRSAGPIDGSRRVRIHVIGLPRPIEPIMDMEITVQRGATGKAVDALGSVLWSGPTGPES